LVALIGFLSGQWGNRGHRVNGSNGAGAIIKIY
jgi:hypothetical protein